MLKIFKNKIILFYLSSIFFLSSVFVFLTYHIFKNEVINNAREKLVDIANYIDNSLYSQDDFEKIVKSIKKSFRIRITFIDENGKVLFDSEIENENLKDVENHATRPEFISAINNIPEFSIRKSPTLGIRMMYYARAVKVKGKTIVVRSAIEFDYIEKQIHRLRNKILFSFMAIIFALSISGVYFISRILHPFDKIIYSSKEFARGNFSHRVFIDFKGEMKKLAQTLNTMASNIERMISELNQKNTYLSMLLNNINAGICLIDEKKEIINYNKKFSEIFNIKSEIMGKNINSVCAEPSIIENLEIVASQKRQVTQEIKLCSNGRFYILTVLPVINEGKDIVILYDINQIKQIELMKRDLLTNISHDFKTPLTVIKTNIETIMSGEMDKKTLYDFLKTIEKHVDRLSELTKDIIELNFIESQKIRLNNKFINLKNFLSDLSSYFTQAIGSKKLKFLNEVDPGIYLWADEWILEKIFVNLFDNAVKFSSEGGYIKCYNTLLSSDIEIIFENTGEKIDEKDIDRIFERFYKADKSRGKLLGASGLGLSIVKHSLGLYGANIRASNFSEGTRFFIKWPLKDAKTPHNDV